MSVSDDLFKIADRLKEQSLTLKEQGLDKPLQCLSSTAETVGKAWSGSWLGYHSRVYYANLAAPPAGAHFSQEWGLAETFAHKDTTGEWREYKFDDVVAAIHSKCGNPELIAQKEAATRTREVLEDSQSQVVSVLSTALEARPKDSFLENLLGKIKELCLYSEADFADALKPRGQVMSRDSLAAHAGFKIPPHFSVLVEVHAIEHPFLACEELSKYARRVASHLQNVEKHKAQSERVGTNVFIGHGRSRMWKDLKDFIQDRMRLPWDEFNRVPVAGTTNVARLAQMLDEAAIAFLVMTAEDEQADGKQHARQNVIHEAGLFQGRLGFERAILLVEDGCEEFTNVQGLGQIRFPKDEISAVFEDIRRVLEREGLVDD